MDDPTNLTVEQMLAALVESEVESAAGPTLPLEEVLAELRRELDQWRLAHAPDDRCRLHGAANIPGRG